MAKEQNVALIQKLFDAFGRGDVQTILEHCKSDCEFYYPGPEVVPYTGRKKGSAEIQTYFDALLNTQSNANLSIDQFVADGDTVVAIGHYKAKVNSTGKPIDTPVVLIFQIGHWATTLGEYSYLPTGDCGDALGHAERLVAARAMRAIDRHLAWCCAREEKLQ